MSGSIWDLQEVEDDLRRRWKMDVETMPSRRIASEMSATWQHAFTPNAVIGRAYRLRLPCRTGRRRQYGAPKPVQPRKPKRAPQPPPPPPPMPVALLGSVGACCYPLGMPRTAEFRYCNAPALSAKPYCLEHCQLAYRSLRAA